MLNFLLYPTKERKNMSKHLTQEQRYHIEAYRKAGFGNSFIAKDIGVHPSTIGRELKRNSISIRHKYRAKVAQEISSLRKSVNSRANKKFKNELKDLVVKYIQRDWSPEQVSATLQIKHALSLSFVRIYQYIELDRQSGGELHTHLRFYGKKRRAKYGKQSKVRIKERVSISERPSIVEEKTRIGDFEIDTIIGKGKQGAITTIVDRASAFVKISIPTTKRAEDIENETIRLMSPFKERTHTITSDNGLEFANHKAISNILECEYYFCHPYSSWERGLNEYTNGLIRQYFRKGSSFENITSERIQEVEDKLNHRPRKTLGWRTPYEVFYGLENAA
jgi:IS30 family transposase